MDLAKCMHGFMLVGNTLIYWSSLLATLKKYVTLGIAGDSEGHFVG